MPIKGELLYLMRWWNRVTAENSAPVPSNPPPLPTPPPVQQAAAPASVAAKK